MIKTKFETYIYKNDIVNRLTMIFPKNNLKKYGIILSQSGSKNKLIDWSTTFQKILRIAYIFFLFIPDTRDQTKED